MSRRANRVNVHWETPSGDAGHAFDWGHVRVEVLQDIRSELQAIRHLLECHRIQRMFATIERLDRRFVTKRKPKRKTHATT